MKKVQLILALIALMGLSSAAYALNEYSDDFDGPGFETAGKWTEWGNPAFNGSGQYVQTSLTTGDGYEADVLQGDGIYRTIGAGDFVMNLSLSSVDMDPPNGGWRVYFMKVIDGAVTAGTGQDWDYTEYIQPNLDSWFNTNTEWGALGENTTLWVDAEAAQWSGYSSYSLGEVTDFELQLIWDEPTKEFTLNWSANDGDESGSWTSDSGYSASTANRTELFYVDASMADHAYYVNAMAIELDSYNLTPEPATIALLGLGGLALLRRRIF